MEWYYAKGSQQSGPVEESTLKDLVSRGKIPPETLVWKDGMQDWAPFNTVFSEEHAISVDCPTCGTTVNQDRLIPAGDMQVCPSCRDEYAQGLREGMARPVRRRGGLGTGGMTPNSDLRAMARANLSGFWGVAVLATFLFNVVQQAIGFVPILGPIIQWVIVGPLTLGFMAFFMALNRGGGAEVGTVFEGFSRFLQGFGIYVVVNILVSLAAFAAAIPGIAMIFFAVEGGGAYVEEDPMFIAAIFVAAVPACIVGIYMYLRYALAYFIANDNPESGVMQPIRESAQRMHGHKKKLFSLYLSFIGWHFLGALAFLIGLLWSMTYMWTALAAFYDDLGEDS